MKKEISWTKKVFALILSGILLLSSIPVALATDNSTKDEPSAELGAATMDEAVGAAYPSISPLTNSPFYRDGDRAFFQDGELPSVVKIVVKASDLAVDENLRTEIVNNVVNKQWKHFFAVISDVDGNPVSDYLDFNSVDYNSKQGTIIFKLNTSDFPPKDAYYLLSVQYTDDNAADPGNNHDQIAYNHELYFTWIYTASLPEVTEITYDGKTAEQMEWVKDSIEVEVAVTNSPILSNVTIDDTDAEQNGFGLYTRTFSEAKTAEIKVYNKFGTYTSAETAPIKSDTQPPSFEYCALVDKHGNEVTDWTNKNLTLKVTVKDTESGVDSSSFKLADGTIPEKVEATGSSVTASFTITKQADYTVSYADNVGNADSFQLMADDVKIDKTAPKASDITLTFSDAQNAGDKFLNFLTFGAYSNNDVKVKVDVNDNGFSEIESVKLYNGGTELEKNGDAFILTAPENDGEATVYDLYVEAKDKAGNNSGKIRFNESKDIKTKLSDGDAVRDLSENLYEVVLSKVVPSLDNTYGNDGIDRDFAHIFENDGVFYVTGDGTVSAKLTENNAGIKSVTATLDGGDATVSLSNTGDGKITEQTASVELKGLAAGEHTVKFYATANSGMQETYEAKVFTVVSGPELDGDLALSNQKENGEQYWTNTDVDISFKLKDSPVDVASVKYYKNDDKDNLKDTTKSSDGYQFTADEYATYTVVATDVLGNVGEFKTPAAVQIDKSSPEVVNGEAGFVPDFPADKWSNDKLLITFTVGDNHDNCSGVKQVTVDGNDVSVSSESTCEFTVTEYDTHEVIVYDNAGNSSKYTAGPFNIDKILPVLDSVSFSAPSNVKPFGAYTNTELDMKLDFSDPQNPQGVCSGIESLVIMDGDEQVVEYKPDGFKDADSYTHNIALTADIHNYRFIVNDKAGNSKEFWLKDSETNIVIADSAKEFELVATLVKPDIDDIDGKFTQGPIVKGEVNYYSGQGTFKTKITDTVAGIDSYRYGFVKRELVSDDGVVKVEKIRDNDALTAKANVSSSSKTKTVDIEFSTEEKNNLQSGDYVAVVYAKNLSGNEMFKVFDAFVDNTVPVIESYDITTPSGTVFSSGENGIYSSEPVTVKMNYTDGTYSVGIDSTQFYNDNKKLGDGTSTQITLSDNAAYHISALVTDKFGQKVDAAQAVNSDVKVRLNGKEIIPDKNNFEIVVNKDKTKLKYAGPNYSYSYENNSETVGDTKIRVLKANGEGTITASLENSLSGIKTVETKLVFKDTQDVTSMATVTVSNNSSDKDAYGKFIRQTITIDAKQIHQSGKYDLTISAVDMCGNKNELTDTFYIDETAPDYVSMDIHKATPSISDQVLNVLSFGIFSNNDLEATVTIRDNGPTGGVDHSNISLTTQKGLSITEKAGSFKTVSGDCVSGKEYQITYTLKKTEDNNAALTASSYSDLVFWCKDSFDNSQYDSAFAPASGVTSNGFNITLGSADIVTSAYAPKISNVKLTGDNRYTDGDGNVWFSNNPTFEFDANDEVSRLHSFSVTLNGTDVSAYCVCNGSQNNYNFTTFNDNNADTDLSGIHVVLNPNTVKAFMREGENNIAYTVTSNNSISSSGESKFFVDLHNPVINSFTFTDAVAPEAQNDNKANGVVNTNYGHFFQVDTIVTVTATDNIIADIPVSGVKDIILFKKDINGSKQQVAMYQRLNTNQATFVIERGFKGQIYAYAVDNVENNRQAYDFTPGVATDGMSVFTPDSVIDETEYQHVANSKLTITPVNEPSNRDNKDNPLYNHDVTLTIFAESSFAGIKSVEFKIYADNFGEINDYRYDCQVDMNGSVAGDWTVLGTENNLVTKVSRNIVISNNYNDITVEAILTDRCGIGNKDTNVSHAKYKFSIDKTAPHIDVQFSPASGNKVDNGDYYKTDRVATITVTERNFNPDDFKLTIRNPHNPGQTTLPISGVSNWNTTYSVDVSNPDAITHVATVTFHDDGDYEMTSAFTDRAGNEADNNNKKEPEFTVDQTLPKISITFDVNNPRPYYNVTRTATIRIEEHNFHTPYVDIKQTAFGADNSTPATPPAVSAWSTSGDVSTATITFADDGKYSFTVDFKDKALNDAVQQREGDFYIDKKIDKIEIVNVKDLTAYDGTIAPEIHYFDQNFDTATYLLKRIDFGKAAETVDDLTVSEGAGNGFSKIVTYADFERVTKNDGIYDLTADITDLAGNKDHKQVVFSVNRFGSTFMISDETTKQLVEDKFYTNNAPDIVVTEINVNEVSDPDIQVNCDDASKRLKKDTEYTISASGGQNQWYAYDYKIFKQNFVNEGNYTVTVSSKDHFDNVVSNKTAYKSETENRTCPVRFVVDKTAPIVTISGIDSNEYYKEAEKEVIVSCEDANITGENLTVELDGERFVSYDKDETSGNIELKLSLQADGNNNERDFKVTVTDKAGNKNEDGEVTGFILGASWLARLFRYHLPLVIIVGALVLGGIAFGVVMAVRKNNKKKAES